MATFATAEEAHNFRAFLESYEIPAYVRDEDTAATYAMALGGVRVDVDDPDFARAAALHASVSADPTSADDLVT